MGAALTASGFLIFAPPPDRSAAAPGPLPAAVVWPHAQRGSAAATLPDGTAYEPGLFLSATSSVGTAQTKDNRFLRLLVAGATGPSRELRRLPLTDSPSFQEVTVSGDTLIWAEGSRNGRLELWAAGIRDRAPARRLTADTGAATFFRSQYDLVVAEGRVHWVASGAADGTEVRSVALTGGAVDVRAVPGRWQLSAWPWLVNGVTAAAGVTALHNLTTNAQLTVPNAGERASTNCSPAWCQVMALARSGYSHIDLMRPDGSDRRRVAGGQAQPGLADVAPLDRFEVISQTGPTSTLTGNDELLVYDLRTRQTVQVSPDAGKVAYRNGVLWWATGNLDTFVWHCLDLRTV